MRKMKLIGLSVIWPVLAIPADKIQPLNIKPGLWEQTRTVLMEGQPHARTVSDQSCFSQSASNWESLVGKQGKNDEITVSIVKSSGSELVLHLEIHSDHVTGTADISAYVLTPERIAASDVNTMTFGNRTRKIRTEITARWIAADCGAIK